MRQFTLVSLCFLWRRWQIDLQRDVAEGYTGWVEQFVVYRVELLEVVYNSIVSISAS